MVNHIVAWCFKEDIPMENRINLAEKMREEFSALVDKVPGLISCNLVVQLLNSSTHDMVLISQLESMEALKAYQVNREHNKLADTYVRPYVCNRVCIDFTE